MTFTNIYFVRHGDKQPKKNYSDIEGQALHLTSLGAEQAQATGKYLAKSRVYFERIITSPYIRCRQTAMLIASVFGHTKVECNTWLTERILHREDLPERLAKENIARAHREPDWAPVGGESLEVIRNRFGRGIQEYLHGGSCPTPRNLLVVTHGRILQTWLGYEFEKPELMGEELIVQTCSLTVVRWTKNGSQLLNFNDTRHLAGLEKRREVLTD